MADKIAELHFANPEWTWRELAEAVGVDRATVYAAARARGFVLPLKTDKLRRPNYTGYLGGGPVWDKHGGPIYRRSGG
jgi:hypothetical protein